MHDDWRCWFPIKSCSNFLALSCLNVSKVCCWGQAHQGYLLLHFSPRATLDGKRRCSATLTHTRNAMPPAGVCTKIVGSYDRQGTRRETMGTQFSHLSYVTCQKLPRHFLMQGTNNLINTTCLMANLRPWNMTTIVRIWLECMKGNFAFLKSELDSDSSVWKHLFDVLCSVPDLLYYWGTPISYIRKQMLHHDWLIVGEGA